MREIKFRAWDKYGNTMRLVKSINYADDGFAKTIMVHLVGGISYGYVHGESCELMQYTGLKDKNGKEIYEGDILSWSDWERAKQDTPIEWDNDLSRFVCRLKGGHWRMFSSDLSVEVIGNIYEHPKLLK